MEGRDLDDVREAETRLVEDRLHAFECGRELLLGVGDAAAVRAGADLTRAEQQIAAPCGGREVEAVVHRLLRGGDHEVGLLHGLLLRSDATRTL